VQEAQGCAEAAEGYQGVEDRGFADGPLEAPLLAQEPGHADDTDVDDRRVPAFGVPAQSRR